jgi:hypothetical protein
MKGKGKRILEEEQLDGEELRGSRNFVRVYIHIPLDILIRRLVGVPRGLVQ